MKALTCELCGGNDIVKQDGFYVCQHCGTKYTVEEAKKLIIEGHVDVSGSTVKVDNTDELANLFQIARRARDDNNSEKAAKYYDMILIKDPKSWEAYFYSVYFTTMTCKIGEISTAARNVSNCIESTFQLIKEYIQDVDERILAISEINSRVNTLSRTLYKAANSHIDNVSPTVKQKFQGLYTSNAIAAASMPAYVCDSLCDVFVDDEGVMRSVGIQILKDRINEGIAIDASSPYVLAIQKYEPSYLPPANQTVDDIMKKINSNNSSGGCYVATAIYGSYDCPQVWTLRRFRDDVLAKTWYGRAFVRTYYAVSPALVKWFGNTTWFKNMWKPLLDWMVQKLQSAGVLSTPYNDRVW